MNNNPDYYTDENGLLVFTAHFLSKRGFCCGNGCRHCPYDYINVPMPKRAALLKKREDEKKHNANGK
jgi:hypothetical protein